MALQIDSVSAEARTRRGWLRESAQDEDIAPGSPRRISIFGLGYVGAVSLANLRSELMRVDSPRRGRPSSNRLLTAESVF